MMVPSEKSQPIPRRNQTTTTEDEPEDLPPAYSMSSSATSPAERSMTLGRTVPGLPSINFAAYLPPSASATRDLVTITITDSALVRSPQAMERLLVEQLALPPMPEMRIRGTHKEWGVEKIDFDLRLNMQRYFLPRDGEVGLSHFKLVNSAGKYKATLPVTGPSATENWARAFCNESATEKSFTITRKLSNWDSEHLVGRILGLVQALNYKGSTEVTFPVAHQRVVIRGAQSFGSAIRSAFGGAGRFEVEVSWPYATHSPNDDSDSDGHSVRRCLVRSEVGWFKDWKPVLRAAMLGKRRGWIGIDDWAEVAARPAGSENAPAPWGAPI